MLYSFIFYNFRMKKEKNKTVRMKETTLENYFLAFRTNVEQVLRQFKKYRSFVLQRQQKNIIQGNFNIGIIAAKRYFQPWRS